MLCDEKKAQECPQPIRHKSIRLQPIRPIYKPCPSTTTTTSPDLEIVHIVIQQDSEGKEIVLWEDVVDAFRDAVNVRHGTMILPFLKDKDLKRLHPPRIAAMPNTALDVLVDTPTTLPVVQSTERQSATQSPPKPAPSPNSSTRSRQRQQRSPKNISIAIVTEEFGKTALMARRGDAKSQIDLARAFHRGSDGLSKNYELAFKWFLRAAEQEDPTAETNVGFLIMNGQGAPRDTAKATLWYLKVADRGCPKAQISIGDLYYRSLGILQDYTKPAEWLSKAAHQGYAEAQFRLGYALERGQGVPKDDSKALEWYFKAAAQGHPAAQAALGVSYHDGLGVPQDFALAMEWYLKAAGQAEAQVGIGMLHHNGEGVVRNPTKAMKWYMKAANQGSKEGREFFEKLKAKGFGSHLELALPPAYTE